MSNGEGDRKFAKVNLDWSDLPERYKPMRRLAQWHAYKRGEELPTGTVVAFEKFIVGMIERGFIKAVGPGAARMLKNFGFAVAKHVATGRKKVPEAIRVERITICRECPLYNTAKGTCRHPECGCVMQRKVRWASTECAIGNWGEYHDD